MRSARYEAMLSRVSPPALTVALPAASGSSPPSAGKTVNGMAFDSFDPNAALPYPIGAGASDEPPTPPPSPPTGGFGDDILIGAAAIALFLFGAAGKRRKVFHLVATSRLPIFRLGAMLCARKSVLQTWIAEQERQAPRRAPSGTVTKPKNRGGRRNGAGSASAPHKPSRPPSAGTGISTTPESP